MSELEILKEAVSGDLDGLLDKAEDVEKGYEDKNPEQFNEKRTTMKEGEGKDDNAEGDDTTAEGEGVDKMPMDDEKEKMGNKKKMGNKRKAEDIDDVEKMEILAKGMGTILKEVQNLSKRFDSLEKELEKVQQTAGEALEKADNTTVVHSAFDDLNMTLGTEAQMVKQVKEEQDLWKGVLPDLTSDQSLHI